MAIYILKTLIRVIGFFGLIILFTFAVTNPAVKQDVWVLYVLATFVMLNIILNEPEYKGENKPDFEIILDNRGQVIDYTSDKVKVVLEELSED